jgi:hypothetical protein
VLGRLAVAVATLSVLAGGCGGQAVRPAPESESPVVVEPRPELSQTLDDLNTADQHTLAKFELASK